MRNCLTDKQILFCEEYLIDFNGTRAYKAVYQNVKKNSSARTNASRLLTKANISAYLKDRKDEMFAKLEVTSERTLRTFARRAYFDPRTLLDENGILKPLNRMDRNTAACITKMKVKLLKPIKKKDEETGEDQFVEQHLVEVEWDNGNTSRDALAKYQGLFEIDNAQKKPNVDIYNQVRAEIEKEMVEDVFDKIEQQNKERDPDDPDLT